MTAMTLQTYLGPSLSGRPLPKPENWAGEEQNNLGSKQFKAALSW